VYGEPGGDDRTWGMLAHLGGVAGLVLGAGALGWVVPLVIFLWKRRDSPFAAFHALQALLFHLAWAAIFILAGIVTVVLMFVLIGFLMIPLLLVMGLVPLIWSIVAAVRANNGEWYRYPIVGEIALRNSL
jgi:uncharacterized protein